jgi:hypothetical protein
VVLGASGFSGVIRGAYPSRSAAALLIYVPGCDGLLFSEVQVNGGGNSAGFGVQEPLSYGWMLVAGMAWSYGRLLTWQLMECFWFWVFWSLISPFTIYPLSPAMFHFALWFLPFLIGWRSGMGDNLMGWQADFTATSRAEPGLRRLGSVLS